MTEGLTGINAELVEARRWIGNGTPFIEMRKWFKALPMTDIEYTRAVLAEYITTSFGQPMHRLFEGPLTCFEQLQGRICTKVEHRKPGGGDPEQIYFELDTGEKYSLLHERDCCEDVYVEDIIGDLNDLVGTPLVFVEESTNSKDPYPSEFGVERPSDEEVRRDYWRNDSFTWTFYRFRTVKGDVSIRWFGSSNGYYSEDVSFVRAYVDRWSNYDRKVDAPWSNEVIEQFVGAEYVPKPPGIEEESEEAPKEEPEPDPSLIVTKVEGDIIYVAPWVERDDFNGLPNT